jgi:YbbR domain-containing protein
MWHFVAGEDNVDMMVKVPVEVINLPQDLIIANEVPSLIDVRISGPRTLLMKVSPSDISIAVDLTDLKPGLTTFKRLEERLNLPSGLRVTRLSPSFIDLKLERVKQKWVPIKIALTGEPLEGHQVGRVSAVPERVIISGAESELKSVNEVTTEPIDLNGVNDDFSLIVPLVHQGNYTDFKDEKTTEVQVKIQAVELPAETETEGEELDSQAAEKNIKEG